MKIIIRNCIVLILILKVTFVFSQVTVTSLDNKEELSYDKPEPYDSLSNWDYYLKPSEYKKYIGQKIYLPNIDQSKEQNVIPYLFKSSPQFYKLNEQNNVNKVSDKYIYNPSNIAKEYHKTLITDSLYTDIYHPLLFSGNFDYYNNKYDFKFKNNNDLIGNKYYQIIDIIYGKSLNTLFKLDLYCTLISEETKVKKNEIIDLKKNIRLNASNVAFVLLDLESSDTVYYWEKGQNKFILVSYFVKQKELFENRNLINQSGFSTRDVRVKINSEDNYGNTVLKEKEVKVSYGSKWLCKEVTVLEQTGKMVYLLVNENGDMIAIDNLNKSYKFILESELIKQEQEKQLLAEQLEAKRKKELQEEKERERVFFENRKRECISKYGVKNGELIANNKVKIGMTKEMCEMAWGKPMWINKTTTEYGLYENWHFGFTKSLHFENGILNRIEE